MIYLWVFGDLERNDGKMAIETNELIDVQTLSPFKKFIMTIGNLPTSYLESMTYGEMLMWFCNYLQETVIPTVNNNALAVEELQNLYEELKNYVDNYFENLDVQEEINVKLDEMVTDGTLPDIVESYVTPILNDYTIDIKSNNPNNNYIHISLDDGYHCLNDLKTNANTYTSIFDNVFFDYLKTLHTTYGAKFSIYVFTQNLTSMPTKFQDDFTANYDWLKFGYHAVNGTTNLENSDYANGISQYNDFVTKILTICGSPNCIDRVPRLSNFAGNVGAVCGCRDAKCGVMGLLSADDTRISYYFNKNQNNYVNRYYNFYDIDTGLYFAKSITRLESMDNITSTLESYLSDTTGDALINFEIFSHEDVIYTPTAGIKNTYLEQVCQFAQNYNIKFDYLENKIQNNRSIVANYKKYVKYFDDFIETSDNTVNQFHVGGITNSKIDTTLTNTGRCVTQRVIKVPNNSTLNFSNQLDYSISYALLEYGSDPVTNKQLDGGESFARWLTDSSLTLNSNTKYIIIIVKHSDNSTTDFTDAELISIGNSFTIS